MVQTQTTHIHTRTEVSSLSRSVRDVLETSMHNTTRNRFNIWEGTKLMYLFLALLLPIL